MTMMQSKNTAWDAISLTKLWMGIITDECNDC